MPRAEGSAIGRKAPMDLDLVGKSLSLLVILLPGIGVLVRYVAFSFDSSLRPAWRFALSAPLSLLATTGLFSTLMALTFFLSLVLARREAMFHRDLSAVSKRFSQLKGETEANAELRKRYLERVTALGKRLERYPNGASIPHDLQREARRMMIEGRDLLQSATGADERLATQAEEIHDAVAQLKARKAKSLNRRIRQMIPFGEVATALILLAVGVALILFFPAWPSSIVPLAAGPSLLILTKKLGEDGDHSFSRLWPAVLMVGVFGIAYGGLAGLTPGVDLARYSFSENASVPEGYYMEIGTSGDRLLLKPCSENTHVVSVRSAEIASITYTSPSAALDTGLFFVLAGRSRASVGWSNKCPG